MGGIYVGRSYDYGPTGRVSDLMLEQGRARAEGSARSGALWGNAIANVGQAVGQAVEAHQGRKRDTAVTNFITSWDGKDPNALLMGLTKIAGPELGPRYAKATIAAWTPPHQDPEVELGGLGDSLDLLGRLDDTNAARVYPHMVKRYGGTISQHFGIPPEQLPPDWSPELRPYLGQVRQSLPGAPKPQAPIKGSPGDVFFDPATQQPIPGMAVPKPEAPVRSPALQHVETAAGIQAFNPETGQLGPVIAPGRPNAPAAPKDERLVQIVGPNGAPIWVREGQAVGQPAAQAARAVTGQERQSLAYFNRAQRAFEDADAVADKLGNSFQLQYAHNMLQTGPQQSYRQAQRAFTEARLRKESGAAIPEHEIENDARTYFKQPGDTPQVLAQKKAAREEVLNGMRFGAGKAYDEYYGEAAPRPATGGAPAGAARGAAPAQGPRQIKSDADYAALPSGAEFIAPDGSHRRKP